MKIHQKTTQKQASSSINIADVYMYGFNGKEDIKEVYGWQDYGERIYNKAICRFFSADPIIVYGQQYPELSPYQFASNTPIWAIDLDGLEPILSGMYYTNNQFVAAPDRSSLSIDLYSWAWDGNTWKQGPMTTLHPTMILSNPLTSNQNWIYDFSNKIKGNSNSWKTRTEDIFESYMGLLNDSKQKIIQALAELFSDSAGDPQNQNTIKPKYSKTSNNTSKQKYNKIQSENIDTNSRGHSENKRTLDVKIGRSWKDDRYMSYDEEDVKKNDTINKGKIIKK